MIPPKGNGGRDSHSQPLRLLVQSSILSLGPNLRTWNLDNCAPGCKMKRSSGEGNRPPSYELILQAGHALDTLRVGMVEDRMVTVGATEDSALAATGAQEVRRAKNSMEALSHRVVGVGRKHMECAGRHSKIGICGAQPLLFLFNAAAAAFASAADG